jgi:competence protein ComEC
MGRPAPGWSALVGSALVVLAWEPRELFDIGAQLSYGIVAGLIAYGLPLARLFRERVPLYAMIPAHNLGPWRRAVLLARDFLCDAAGAGIAAFIIAAPLSAQYFGVFAPGGILLNILMVPLSFALVVAAILGIALAGLASVPGLGLTAQGALLMNSAGWFCAFVMHAVIEAVSHVPGLFFTIRMPAPWIGGALTLGLLGMILLLHSTERLREHLGWQLAPLWVFLGVMGICAV